VTATPGASDQPVLADAGPAFAGHGGLPADLAAGPPRRGAGAAGRDPAGLPRSAGVLADRIAAALVHHEPGWRLPRHTALARRYNVSAAEISAAIGELVARHLVRRLPDGQMYRASPAEYLLPLEGVSGLASRIDPMGAEIVCRSRQVSWRRLPEDVGSALGVPAGEPACVVRLLWTSGGEPVALATSYLARHVAGKPADADDVPPVVLSALELLTAPGPPTAPGPLTAPGANGEQAPDEEPAAAWAARSVLVEMQPPPPSIARSLRLSAGQPAAIVTVRFDEPAGGRPAALTVAVLRPDMFRIVVETTASPLPGDTAGSFSGAWTYAVQDWEP
jgi:UTRA domain-containing protein